MKTDEIWTDPIIEEIHQIRRELVREAGGTLEALSAWIMESQKRHGEKLIDLSGPPKAKPPRRQTLGKSEDPAIDTRSG